MDFFRFLIASCLLFLAFHSHSEPDTGNLGVAFIHGTDDHTKDADGGYWKHTFIDPIIQSLPIDSYFIVACNYQHQLWHPETAGCTVDQLSKFITDKNISKLLIYTHSHGANVIRYILSNPSYDKHYYKLSSVIKEVVALAPSSGGTVLADEVFNGNVFEAGVGWLLGYRNAAVKQQRIGDMALLNKELLLGTPGRPSLPTRFRSVVGTNVNATPFTEAGNCGGYILNAALKLTKIYLDNCSDGFLSCVSQSLAGEVWFYDTHKTTNNFFLSHNQSRHACFSFEKILYDDLMLNKTKHEG